MAYSEEDLKRGYSLPDAPPKRPQTKGALQPHLQKGPDAALEAVGFPTKEAHQQGKKKKRQ